MSYTVYNMFNFVKEALGFEPSELSWNSAAPTPTTESHPTRVRFTAESDPETDPSDEAQEEQERGNQVHTPIQAPNNVTAIWLNAPRAFLKGSPKALGWQVDEEKENEAWVMLMKDAIEGSIHEFGHTMGEAKKEMYKNYQHWHGDSTTLVWSVVPSLKGIHRWILRPRVHLGPSVLQTGSDVATIATTIGDGLLDVGYAEAAIQTTPEGRYVDEAIQTDDPEVPQGALLPLPDKTPLLDLVPTEPRPISPTVSTDSRSPSPSRLPRRNVLRKMSLASIASSIVPPPQPPLPSQVQDTIATDMPDAVRRTASLRSMNLRRAFGAKKSSGSGSGSGGTTAAPTVALTSSVSSTLPVESVDSGSAAKLDTPDAPDVPDVPVTSSPDQQAADVPPPNVRTASKKLISAMARFGREKKVVDAWKP